MEKTDIVLIVVASILIVTGFITLYCFLLGLNDQSTPEHYSMMFDGEIYE